jgi:hypothetical protein
MRCYETAELSFHAQEPTGSYVTVDLKAEITGPDGTKTIPGFYAGNDTYKVRFLPETAGDYTYRTSGIISEEGTVHVESADKTHHGIVRADGTNFRYEDGTTFTGFGTTIYALAHQKKELIDETMETLANAPFNKIRMCVFPKHYNYTHNEPEHYAFYTRPGKENEVFSEETMEAHMEEIVWDVHHPDFAFWDHFEMRLGQLFAMGIQVDLILFHPYDRWGFSCMSREDSLTYLDYVVRRFSAYPNIWWSLANEYEFLWKKDMSDWDAFGEFLAQNDPYHHLLSNHNCFRFFDFSKDYVTHCSLQTHAMNRVEELQKIYHKPVCYDECCYEGNINENWGNLSGQEMTRRFWQATVTGGHCTHGETFLAPEKAEDMESVVYWARGGRLIGESPKRIAFLREVVESLPGPLAPYPCGITKLVAMAMEHSEEIRKAPMDNRIYFMKAICRMDDTELLRYSDMDFEYAGHVGDQVYLYYLDHHTCARKLISLPEGKTCKVEVIDTWNMTREVYAENAVGSGPENFFEVRLPGREYMAILIMVQ